MSAIIKENKLLINFHLTAILRELDLIQDNEEANSINLEVLQDEYDIFSLESGRKINHPRLHIEFEKL